MRVIAGAAGGRRLRAPKGDHTRPTSDRVKESMFASLGPGIQGVRALDLYAGSGALGIEALSRGAVHATFVESRRDAVNVIHHNLAALGYAGQAAVLAVPVEKAAARISSPVELVLADPPYAEPMDTVFGVLAALAERDLVTAGTQVVIERSRRAPDTDVDPPPFLELARQRNYGDTALWYFTVNQGA